MNVRRQYNMMATARRRIEGIARRPVRDTIPRRRRGAPISLPDLLVVKAQLHAARRPTLSR